MPLAVAAAPAPPPPNTRLALVDWMRRSTLLSGMPGVTAETTALASTADGFLWVGTYSGLARFDGLEFRSESLPGRADRARISALACSDDDALWVGSLRGLARRHRGTWEALDLLPGSAPPWVTAIDVAAGGAFAVVGTDAHGAFVVEGGRARPIGGLPSKRVTALRLDPDGSALIGTDAGLRRFTGAGSEVTTDGVPRELTSAAIAKLARSRGGEVYVATESRIGRVDHGELLPVGGTRTHVTALEVAPDDALWVGSIDGGVERIANGSTSALGTSDGLPQSPVFSFGFDREGGTWVGFEAGGLVQLRPGGVRTFDRRSGMPHDLVWSIGEARESLWFATKGGGLLEQRRNGERDLWAPSTGFPSSESLPPIDDGTGGLWFPTYGQGVFRGRDREHLELFGPREGLPNVFVYAARRSSSGALWVGTRSGVALFEGQRFTVPPALAPLASERIRMITEAPAGSALEGLWFGSNRTLARYVRGALTRWSMVDDLHLDELQGLAFLRDGTLLLTTSGTGLVRFDGAATARLGQANGLPSDYLYGVSEDDQGRVWATSNAGVAFAPREALLAAFDAARTTTSARVAGITIVDTRDGLTTAQCYSGVSPSLTIARDGVVWAPTASGAVRIDAARLLSAPTPPPVRVDAIRVDDRDLLPHERSIAASVKTVEFAFGATTFQAPNGVRFRYRLRGLDDRWVDVGAQIRSARFTDLAGNRDYVFEVEAAQGPGPFSAEPAAVTIHREPKFYETWTARLLAVGVFAGIAMTVARARERTLRQRALELERVVRVRTQDLAKKTQSLDEALTDLRTKDSLLRSDLSLARDFVEHSKSHVSRIDGLVVQAFEKPLDLVGGDLWHATALTPRQLRVLLADTTGHGVQASMRALALQHEFAQVARDAASPADALTRLDGRLVSRFPGLELRTSALCVDVVTQEDGAASAYLSFAGAPPAFHLRRDGTVSEVLAMDGFLGVDGSVRRRSTRVDLALGEGLVVFTDGLSEATSPAGEAFGEDRMREALEGRKPVEARFEALLAAAQSFVEAHGYDDDVTALLLVAR
jgi:ligand-binding sensor domain-containing protein/serine phosphatase RsbU (regulator of sigma subunit)